MTAEPMISISTADGTMTQPLPLGVVKDALNRVRQSGAGSTRPPVRNTPADEKVKADAFGIAAEELRQFIERFEQLEAEKKDIADQQKELMAEAKGRGFDTRALRKIVALRKRKPDDIAEEEATLEMYKTALGMS